MIKNYNYIGDLVAHEHNHKFLGEPLLVPNVNKTDCNRLTMFCAQLSQSVPNTEGEAPLIMTNFEDQVGEYTIDGFLRSDSDKEILAKIQRNKLNYTLIVRDSEGMISHIDRREGCWLTEHYGFRYNNTVIDNKQPGDTIKEDEMLYRANSYDDEGNLKYGRNMNLCFTVFKNLTLEDPMVISKSAAEKMSYDSVNRVSISLNHNDLLINLYGDEDDYKAFPNIGEEVRDDTILCSRRRIDYNKLLPKLKDSRLMDIDLDDTIFYCGGRVIDIEIYTNQDEKDLAKQEYNNQIYNLYMEDKAYKKKLVECVEEYMEPDGSNMTPELVLLYNRAKLILENDDKKAKNIWVDDNNGSDFKGTKLVFTIMEHHPLTVGSKLSGRFGNKGVVSAILPDNMMPEIEEGPFKGQRMEVIANALGIFNRLIPSCCYEQELNFIGKYIRYYISQHDTLEGRLDELYKYLELANPVQLEWTKEYVSTLTTEEAEAYIQEMIDTGIPLIQPPFYGNLDLDGLTKIYETYPGIQEFKFKGIKNPMIMGEMFLLTLKHDTRGKMSIRSTGFNNMSDLPAKSKAKKDYKIPFSSTPIRLGEMEVNNILLTKDNTIQKLLMSYATNNEKREELLEAIIDDPFHVELDYEAGLTRTASIARQFFKCLGIEIYDEDDEPEDETEEVNEEVNKPVQ